MADEDRPPSRPEPVDEEGPLERPGTDTKLISEMDPSDAAQAIREALGPAHGGAVPVVTVGRPQVDGVPGGGGEGDVIEGRLSELEARFARIEAAIEELRRRLDRED